MDARRKILVVDDAELFRDLESVFLARSGQVIAAADGPTGLAVARAERPSVAVIDLHMPGVEGDVVCAEIKRDPDLRDRTRVVLVTGSEPDDHARAVRAGADDVVPKPLNRSTFIEAVNRLMRPETPKGLTRVPLETEVRIRCASEDAWGTTRNLSRGGLFVYARRPVPPDTEVELEFELPDGVMPLAPTARVVWNHVDPSGEPDGMGLRFLALDRDSVFRIEEFVYTHPEARSERDRLVAGASQ